VAEPFSPDELQQIHDRALELAQDQESDASLRTGLQLFAEAAANLMPKIGGTPADADVQSD
jgi:hypothetical protein